MKIIRKFIIVCCTLGLFTLSACSVANADNALEDSVSLILDIQDTEEQIKAEPISEITTEITECVTEPNETTISAAAIEAIVNKHIERSDSTELDIGFADLNNDGVDELFITDYDYAGRDGFLSVYDLTVNDKCIGEIFAKFLNNGMLYADENNQIHFILRTSWYFGSDNYSVTYCDVTYDSITVPFCAVPHWWYDDMGMFDSEYAVYTDVDYTFSREINFENYGYELTDNKFKGYFDLDDISIGEKDDSAEIKQIIDEYVLKDLEPVGDFDYRGYFTPDDVYENIVEHYGAKE